MKAVIFTGKERVAVEDVDEPRLEDASSAIVEVERTSICGSDLHFYWDEFNISQGVRPGHEFIGTVAEVGSEVESLCVGDRVMAMGLYGCGHCSGCADDRPTACTRGWVNFGTTLAVPGGQAQLVRAPHADHVLRRLPTWISDDDAVLMTDVLPTGAFAARNAGIEPGSTVVVIGLGPIGLSSVANAFAYQPARVIAFDGLASRRGRAAVLGAEVFDPGEAGVVEQVLSLTAGVGADSVIEAVGRPETVVAAVSAARVGGTVSVIGVLTEAFPVHPLTLGTRNITLRVGTTDVPLMWKRLLPLLEQGQVRLADVFTHRLPLTDAARGYEIFANRADDVFKVVFDAQS
ncbi:hypothetical protein CcI49_18355 [Frankia sp. CcI49]|uniref:alcohol dehydrogenase catalytic domain-containing protein n=1 Tax=unclassified Frankia TaxID=2632575 RepID=UPI0006C9EDB2|nr:MULTISPECIES: alcohol dehydrogenase catalytic domain-containing protein [unclassified Frankia]KPM51761.1 hypothetical protein ACG83_33655 [Frankia sp. R43]ONH59106.1 hypothetical protein CcI49_18355 [Frankia sp. CcI49]